MPTTPESSEALNDAADTPETAPLVELEIGRIAHGGHCVARYDGRVVFVRHTLPGETVRARLTDSGETSKFWRADAVEILVASPDRVRSAWPQAGADGVGGAVTLWSGRVGAGGRRSAVLCRSGFGLGTGSLRSRVSSLGAASEQSHWFVSFGWVHVRRTWHGGTSTSRSARSWSAVTCL